MPRVIVPYAPREWAKPFHAALTRFAVLILHRRAGKTTAVLNHHQRAALDDAWERRRLGSLTMLTPEQVEPLLRHRLYGHVMPTYKQAKLAAWDMLKFYAQPIPAATPNEAELSIRYPNGSKIQLFGADNPDSLRGPGFSGLSFDEYSQHPPNIFGEVLSKSLADHLGYAIFAGTIQGKDQLYRTYQAAQGDRAWFALWQNADKSLASESDAAIQLIRQAMTDDRALIEKSLMTQADFDQEWFLSAEAATKGAWYGPEMATALARVRITNVPHDPVLPVDTDWDLGVDDSTAIWFSQSTRSGEIRVIDYHEASGEGLPHYANVLKAKGYVYGQHWAPHDIQVRELGSGKSRRETAASLGIRFEVVRHHEIVDGINAVRLTLPKCWFDATKCARGIEALRRYRKTWSAKMGEFSGTPVHDWSSHAADAFRGLAVRHKPPEEPRVLVDEYIYRFPTEHDWMGM